MDHITTIGQFNHRILRSAPSGIELYKIVTVYYDLDGTPTDYTTDGGSGCSESLYNATIEALEAFARPILDIDDIDFSRSILEKEDQYIGMTCYTKKEE